MTQSSAAQAPRTPTRPYMYLGLFVSFGILYLGPAHALVHGTSTSISPIMPGSRVATARHGSIFERRCTRRRTKTQLLGRQISTRRFASKDMVGAETGNNVAPKVGVVGGGLAGLSTAYHLLKKTWIEDNETETPGIHLTVIDKAEPGDGGASSVAGGLLHPFSPRGKLVHMGEEGLIATQQLVGAAQPYEPSCVLRDRLYRVALTEANVQQLRETAEKYPEWASWLGPNEVEKACGARSLGGLELTNGCKVIDVSTYLRGLWAACRAISHDTAKWKTIIPTGLEWKEQLKGFDTVIFAAGAGMFRDDILKRDAVGFPAELVRGQSIEMALPSSMCRENEAVLCGKYVTPMIGKDRILVGATHEFQSDALSEVEVVDELKQRSQKLAPLLWEKGSVAKITKGYRVQSRRGKWGRMPIVGRSCGDLHEDAWLFTGLSSRGLIHHGIYGDILSDAILEGSDEMMIQQYPELDWWKRS